MGQQQNPYAGLLGMMQAFQRAQPMRPGGEAANYAGSGPQETLVPTAKPAVTPTWSY